MRSTYNRLKTAVLLAVLSSGMLLVGYVIGARSGLIVALILALTMNGLSYFYSDKIALKAMHAYPVDEFDQRRLYSIVRELSAYSGQPMPRVYLSPTEQPNAFATGRSPRYAAVCCTEGIMTLLNERELRGVIGHELSHVYNRDILIASVAATLAGVITTFSQFIWFFGGSASGIGSQDERPSNPFGGLVLMIFGPVAAALIQLAVSRTREYQADADGARITHDPLALASALRKISAGAAALPLQQNSRLVSASHLMIANPFRSGGLASLFSTHPPMEQRIQRLRDMAHDHIY